MIEVELPDGSIAEFPDGTPPETIKGALQKRFGAPQAPQPQEAAPAADPRYTGGIYGDGTGLFARAAKSIGAGADAIGSGLLFGWDDEANAAIQTAGGMAGDYEARRSQLDADKARRREENPIASGVGELAGGLALGGGLAKGGLTLAGRSLPVVGRTGAAALEGGAYGGLYGAGEAAPGERLQSAGTGAALGAVIGGGVSKAGDMVASGLARRSANMAAPAADDLAVQRRALYAASEAEGVRFNGQPIQRLGVNLKIAAGRVNDKLRPKTAGFVDDIDSMFNGPLSLEQFDEYRKVINQELKRASPDDARTLNSMKRVLDNFADNISPADMTGGKRGIPLLEQAREVYGREKKTEVIERILDQADVNTGQYTQSGLSNTIKREMNKLYKQIQSGKAKGFSKEETALIRQMAKGGSSSTIVNLFAKFAPRGVVSFGAGQIVGSGIPGGNLMIPLIGEVSSRMAERSAVQAGEALRRSAATGQAPMINAVTNKTVPFIGATSGQAGSLANR